jgi:hypothetical protein
LLELADRDLGELPQVVILALGVNTTARRVWISAAQQRHAIARRQFVAQFDADLVAMRLADAVANACYLLLPQRNPRIFPIMGYVSSADKWLVLPLKLVMAANARTQADEWWVQTAFPFGKSNLKRALGHKLLQELQPPPPPRDV